MRILVGADLGMLQARFCWFPTKEEHRRDENYLN